ncbi:DUF4251 domain-containing protein [Mucilaginibacter xinganensis]|uniref:DUF4251 domain-containing protein n=1 Tax=Mucilaginibacter xinganensis TaxID=1234841 RepID=A0A223NYE5_9SPHI|nr:DUF4251 domain-containing protein [Mucilaginibacter xinganensis]ASU34873.1 hypothetical protein MuYL_2988 [Mucilaginibacter xinganensis]
MKTLKKLMIVSAMILSCCQLVTAQNSKIQKKAAKAAKVKEMLDAQSYIFNATYVIPQRGNARSITYGYDVVVSKDTVTAYLPYYGRVTLAPADPSDGGVKFTSTNFDYKSEPANNGYDITITPKDGNTQGSKDVRYLRLNVSYNGYASLQVISNNRDPISYNGEIEERKINK